MKVNLIHNVSESFNGFFVTQKYVYQTLDIISSQRRLIEEGNVELPDELKELYGLYQQEIHAGSVTATAAYERKLPPIYTAG